MHNADANWFVAYNHWFIVVGPFLQYYLEMINIIRDDTTLTIATTTTTTTTMFLVVCVLGGTR